jgi:glycosyltransferase involved in cell wall biosynthesis
VKPIVAMIGSRGFPGQTGGVERVLEAVCPRMVQSGRMKVLVYCASWLDYEGDEYRGVELKRVSGLRTKHGDTVTRSLSATLRELRSDSHVVHYHSIGSAPLALLPRLFGKKVVVTVHALDWQRSKWSFLAKSFLRFGEWASVRFPNRTVVVGEEIKTYLEERYGRPVAYIPNGAEIRARRAPELIHGFGLEEDRYLLFLARLVPEKAVHVLIEAFRRLEPDVDLKLAIAGPAWFEPEYEQHLRAIADGDPRVLFLGEVDGELLDELYSNCFAYVLPSEVEGMSLSLLDALAFGCCIVTSSIRPNARLVADAGLIFETGDVASLERRLREISDDRELVQRLRAAASARGKVYSWDSIADQWADVYYELLES